MPVLVPAASLQPGERIKGWLERVLADRYPALRDIHVYGPDAISRLVSGHHLLPVIDSLDELDASRRAQFLIAFNRAFGRSQPVILTCRTHEYHEAVEDSGVVMPGAAVIELQPVTAQNAARYLKCGTAGPSRARPGLHRHHRAIGPGGAARHGPVQPAHDCAGAGRQRRSRSIGAQPERPERSHGGRRSDPSEPHRGHFQHAGNKRGRSSRPEMEYIRRGTMAWLPCLPPDQPPYLRPGSGRSCDTHFRPSGTRWAGAALGAARAA